MPIKPLPGAALLLAAAASAAHAEPYAVVARWPLAGDGGWDYLAVDAASHLLYQSRATHVAIVDLTTGRLAGDIGDTPGVHGIALAPDLGRGYISAGKADKVLVFDLASRNVLASIPVGAKPDAILYDAPTQRVFAFNGHGNSASVIEAGTNRVLATVALGGGPEFARSDNAGHVFVNIENRNELAVIATDALKVTATWALPGCDGPTGLVLDIAHHRSFSVCANAAMTILDTQSGRAVATLPIGRGADGVEFDPASQDAFSANGDGTLTIVHEDDPEHFSVVQTLPTAAGARTIALDPATHRLYLPTAGFGPAQPTLLEAHPKPPVLPGTFVLLAVGPAVTGH